MNKTGEDVSLLACQVSSAACASILSETRQPVDVLLHFVVTWTRVGLVFGK